MDMMLQGIVNTNQSLNVTNQNCSASGSSTVYSIGQYVECLAIIGLTSLAIAIPLGLMAGWKVPQIGSFKGFDIKPLSKKFVMPPLVGMIIFGMIARNKFGLDVKPFPTLWVQYIKFICHEFLLIRAGQQIDLQGQGIFTFLMCTIPQQFECVTVALISYRVLDMPIYFCFALGYLLSCLSPSILIPTCITYIQEGYGKKSMACQKAITGGILDDIVALLLFGLFQGLSYQSAGMLNSSVDVVIGNILREFLTGIELAVGAAIVSKIIVYLPNRTLRIYCKMFYCIGAAIMFVMLSYQFHYPNLKYIAGLVFGYLTRLVWGVEELPTVQFAWCWFIVQPLFFGLVGAGLVWSQVQPGIVGYALLIIVIGLIVRSIIVFIICQLCKLSKKLSVFFLCAWTPKATIQAAVGGTILADATLAKNCEVMNYGTTILAVSIFSIMICAPIGGVLINTISPMVLDREEDDKQSKTYEMVDSPEKKIRKTENDNDVQIQLKEFRIDE